MKLRQFLDNLPDNAADGRSSDLNLAVLERLVGQGAEVRGAVHLAGGIGPLGGPILLLTLTAGDEEQVLPVGVGRRARRRLPHILPDISVGVETAPRAVSSAPAPSSLVARLARLMEDSRGEPPEERAARLMDWCMERIDASRCALLPVDAGVAGEPLAFHVRGQGHGGIDPEHIPSQVVGHVARTRQPLVAHDVDDPDNVLPLAGTVARQRVRSYLAVPVIFRDDLLAVAYVDRLDRPQPFTTEQRAAFEAFAYELARPVLTLRAEQRQREYDALSGRLLSRPDDGRDEPSSPALARVVERARELAAHVDEPLLILGETGVGKEWLARWIHDRSGCTGAFVAMNVSAPVAELFESELMGTARGAFTGAVDRPGRASLAEGGTLLLDELGDLDLANQTRLLRFLEDRRVKPVGSQRERRVAVRIIAATARNLIERVRTGAFRADLLHRFAPPLAVPPLRERREEIVPHAIRWLSAKSHHRGVPTPRLTAAARDYLEAHPWPGNVRQLQMVLSHAMLFADDGEIGPRVLQSLCDDGGEPSVAGSRDPVADRAREDRATTLAELRAQQASAESAWLRRLLETHEGRIEVAARAIACPASTLRGLLKKYGIERAGRR